MIQTQRVIEESALGYDQIQAESRSSSRSGVRNSAQAQESTQERGGTTESTASKTSVQKVHIAFTVSFSIPLTGLFPTNCSQ